MKTTLYLVRHAATEFNLAHPPRLQGRTYDPPLAALGMRQARATRDFLAVRPIDACYCSPLLRAIQTASIIGEPHEVQPVALQALTECDIGAWEGLSWPEIRLRDAEAYERFMSDPAQHGYLDGENFAQVHERASGAIAELLQRETGKSILVVSHNIVIRTYLAGRLGMPIGQARKVVLDNCGVSVIAIDNGNATVATLNSTFHLQGLSAAA